MGGRTTLETCQSRSTESWRGCGRTGQPQSSPFREVSPTPTTGFSSGRDDLVVRIAGSGTELLGIDREGEIAASRIAADLGIGPELVSADSRLGCVVTRFIDGRPLQPAEVGEEPVLGELAAALRRIHGAGTIGSTFEPYRLVTGYHDLAAERGVEEPFDYDAMNGVVTAVAKARPFKAVSFCHNDLLTANLLHDGRIRIVDWEYAGMGDPFFDLGNLAVNHGFTTKQETALLCHYFGHSDDAAMACLHLLELVSEAREAMWGVVQMAASSLDVDFSGYAAVHGEGFFGLLDKLDLQQALHLAESAPD